METSGPSGPLSSRPARGVPHKLSSHGSALVNSLTRLQRSVTPELSLMNFNLNEPYCRTHTGDHVKSGNDIVKAK